MADVHPYFPRHAREPAFADVRLTEWREAAAAILYQQRPDLHSLMSGLLNGGSIV